MTYFYIDELGDIQKGDREELNNYELYEDVQSCLQSIDKSSMYLNLHSNSYSTELCIDGWTTLPKLKQIVRCFENGWFDE